MIRLLIRYVSIVFCISYILGKLINTNLNAKKNLYFNILSGISISILAKLLPTELQFLVAPIIGCIFIIYFKKQYLYPLETVFTIVILSMSLCYSFFFIAGIIVCVLFCIPCYLLFHYIFHNIATQLMGAIFQMLFCFLFFRIKRFKYGMSFLKKSYVSNIGVYIGSILLICTMIVSTIHDDVNNLKGQFYLFLFPIILILFFNIYIWWKSQMRKHYIQQVRNREYTRMEEQLTESLQEIKMLKEENETLSKLIHRDNKLIPSLQLSVHQYLMLGQQGDLEELNATGQKLLQQLNQEMQERSDILLNINTLDKRLPSTLIPELDQCLRYMLHKCTNEGICLEVTTEENILSFAQSISKKDLQTVLADLLENARIALKNCERKYILVELKKQNGIFTLAVWDSASFFPKEVLYHLGRKRYTTHKKDGGSGIGMIAIHEILERYHASIFIDEKLAEETIYTKKIEISFDNKNAYILHTKRTLEEYAYLTRRDDLQILAE